MITYIIIAALIIHIIVLVRIIISITKTADDVMDSIINGPKRHNYKQSEKHVETHGRASQSGRETNAGACTREQNQ